MNKENNKTLLATIDEQGGGLELAVRTMAQLSHPERLRVLCHLSERGEMPVSELQEHVELSASALSQHLTRMRQEGLISARRESKHVYYRIARRDIGQILELLHRLYCES